MKTIVLTVKDLGIPQETMEEMINRDKKSYSETKMIATCGICTDCCYSDCTGGQ